ncbi:MAG: NRAMP family divalent metal transporter [Thermoplasmatota archaeon]
MRELTPEKAGARAPPTKSRKPSLLERLGPGVITGASDDDPSGIGTYSQAGARFGNAFLWTMLFTVPLMSAVQEACGLIGRVTGKGIAANLRERYSRKLLFAAVGAVALANAINIGADVAAMGAGATLIVGGPFWIWAIAFAAATLLLQVLVPYHVYVKYLKWLTLSLAAYVVVAFAVRPDWMSAFRATLVPHVAFDRASLVMLVAILGTTISPCLFFWQASEEVEDDHAAGKTPLKGDARTATVERRRIRLDTIAGMAASNVVAWFIILSTSITLYAHGPRDIADAASAADALRPVAGAFAGALFALGIIATGLLAVPVLAGSAAYAATEAFGWKGSLESKPLRAPQFYAIIVGTVVVGLGVLFVHIDPMRALVWSAVVNGIAAVPLLAVIARMSGDAKVMGGEVAHRSVRALTWVTAGVMAAAAVGLVVSAFVS